MNDLADFDFSLEFSASFATMVLTTSFAAGVTPSKFAFDQPGRSDLVDSRKVNGGPAIYQNYMLNLEIGYDLTLTDPNVSFDVPNQRIDIEFDVGIKLPRNIVARIFDVTSADTPLAADPSLVDVSKDYPEEFRSGPTADPFPGHAAAYTPGTIELQFPPAVTPFGQGKRFFAQTVGTNMSNVLNTDVQLGAVAAPLTNLADVFASKVFSYLIANEAGGYDVTPMIGNLDALSITVKEPTTMRIGSSAVGPVIAYAANISTLGNTGNPSQLKYLLSQGDFCVSFTEAMFNEIISYLYIYDPNFPQQFNASGLPNPTGGITLEQPVLEFLQTGLRLDLGIQSSGGTNRQTITADIECVSAPPAPMTAKIVNLQSGGYPVLDNAALNNLTLAVVFEMLGATTGPVLTSILQSATHNSLDAGLSEFLRTGALAFGFRTPIRGTNNFVEATPIAISFRPGICTFFNSATISS